MALQNFMTSSLFLNYAIFLCSIGSSLPVPSRPLANAASGNETDVFALLKFKESISSDPDSVLSSWNGSVDFCNWPGVSCSKRRQRTTSLDLQGRNLRGTISPYVGNLSFLRIIRLESNSFTGEIPQQLGRLFRLQHLNLSFNMMEGNIPINVSYCSDLRILSLRNNKLTGVIPVEFGSLVKLIHLNLAINNITGVVPPSLGNMSSLSVFGIGSNNLVGNIPDELGSLKSLTFFSFGPNNFSGTIPLSIYNISSLTGLSFPNIQLQGTLPPTIGLTLPNLQFLYMSATEFSGIIPESLSNSSQLEELDVSRNNFVGQFPASLGSLQNLKWLGLSTNSLGSYLTNSLHFISSLTNCSQLEVLDISYNKFGGVLPNSVANLSAKLTKLYLGDNQISGNIPMKLENLVNLIGLGIENNLFTGVVPTSLGKLKNLQVLALRNNRLSGYIPSSLGNLTSLFQLDLSYNKLGGNIPPNIANCRILQFLYISDNSLGGAIPKEVFGIFSLVVFDLSHNLLIGSLPVEVGKLKNVILLELSTNNLTGEIPESIGDCQEVEFLYLNENNFQGTIPSSLGSLRSIQHLDLSRNNLTGKIPKDFQKLVYLFFLNLSFNKLEGEVPSGGIFLNMSAVSLVGNTRLCGGAAILKLQACPMEIFREGKRHGLKVTTIATICVGLAIALFVISLIVFRWKRNKQRKSSDIVSDISSFSKVSYKRLFQATNGFSPSMLIGTGSFGSVYKAILDQGNVAAVKVLNLQQRGASKSFINECNALRNIRHRNLVKILTCCSSMDYKGNEFKALVFEYVSNGSLDKWLNPVADIRNAVLNLLQRLDIVSDVASALSYLHDECDQTIIHCDLKPSNILLDNDMNARVSDFGLARLISNTIDLSGSCQTSTSQIKGTIGYAAPEYAMGGEPSKQGDVYSYGILVLEMFTGRKPTHEMFRDNFNLHNFVQKELPERLVQIVDSALLPREEEEEEEEETSSSREDRRNYHVNNGETEIEVEEGTISHISAHLQKCLVSVLEIGVACSKESPNERMNIGDVSRELQHIRKAYLDSGTRGQRRKTV